MKRFLISLCLFLFADITTFAQSGVTTQQYDIARTGANTNETILTPTNVNTNTFGKLFSSPVYGWVYAQPLYMPGITMGAGTPQAGTTHNVVFVATEHDSVFAFDADSNTGANANPLWQVSLLGAGETTVPSGDVLTNDIVPEIGITSTPVIDPTTNTIYVVAKSTVGDTTFIQRLHALDITTGKEKFGGPVTLSGSVPGNGNGSSGGTLNWDSQWENNRPGLLLLNGIVYIGFGAHGDNGPWHGWILAYNASTLAQTGAWCSAPNAAAAGIWMSGAGLAADVPSGKPYGRIFTATGNGTFDATAPNYSNAMDYGDSIVKLDLNGGVPTMYANGTVVGDDFTPHDQANMDNHDQDVASGGVILLPDSVGGGGGAHQLVQVGKSGRVFVLNRENLGGYNPNNTTDPEQAASVGGLWGAPAYWNGNVYIWGTGDNLKAFSFANGALSASPTHTSIESAETYSPTPTVSANGTTSGIVWTLKTDNYSTQGTAILYAHDATNVANLLYSSESNAARDNPGDSVKFIVPTVVNGKVYVGSESQLSVYGLLNGATQAATPVISPASQSFSPSVQVTITDSTSGASIYYTTNGSQPTTGSTQYTVPFTLTTTTTVNAIAAGTGLEQSPEASATYTLSTQTVMPTFNPPPGYYTAVQSVTISTTTPNATIYYTTDGTTPTTASTKYAGPISVGVTETLSAIAVASALSNSLVASGLYVFDQGVSSINFASGFASGGMTLLGSAKLNGSALELTDGGGYEAAAAWYQAEAIIESFTTDFTFQITPGTNPTADGFTFAIQANNSTAVGPSGGGLGYGPDAPGGTGGIPNSVAVKFDLYSNNGEGTDSTGLYTNGASPTTPAVDMTSSGVNLHSGDPFRAHITYDGTTLAMTITDTTTNATFATNWTVDIPTIVGDVVAYVGFTAGTGGDTAVQNIQSWTYSTGSSTNPPPAPTNLTATAGNGQVGLSWSASSGATSYNVKRSTTSGGAYTTIASPTTTSYTDTGVTNGTTYYYVVSAANTAGQSANSSQVSATPATSTVVINYGSGFSSSGLQLNGSTKLNGTRLRLTDGGSGEASSAFYTTPVNVQSFTTNFSFQMTSAAADGMTFVIQNGAATALGTGGVGLGCEGIGNSVAVKFDIYNNAGEGTDSTGMYVDGAVPTVPAVDMTSSGVKLLSGDVMNVQLSYNGTTLTLTITDASTLQSFTTSWTVNIPTTVGNTTALVGFTGGTGGYTAIQDVLSWTYSTGSSTNPPPAPTNLTATAGNGQVGLSWSASSGATSYNVKRSTTSGGAYTTIASPTTASYTDTGLTNGTTYYYVVSAVNTAGQSANSSQVSATPQPAIPPAPTNLTATAGNGQVGLSWSASSGATSYNVKRSTTSGGAYTTIGSPTTASYTDTGLTNGTTYYYVVSAVNGAGQSANSSQVSATPATSTVVINYGSGFSSSGLQLNGSTKLNGTRLRLTDGGGGEASSAFYTTPVNVQSFTTNFSFQMTSAAADGMTFVIQGNNSTALGPPGGGLGYGPDNPSGTGGIPNSVAVKFDIYNNAGEGTDSTGMYVDGAAPTVPAVGMTSSGVSLLSGDVMNVQLSYNGTTLTLTITDASTLKSFTTSWTVNIPTTVGSTTALVGFTGGTGGLTAIQDILSWTYSTQ